MSPPYAPAVLAIADDALIYAQRLGEWISRAPQIEEDMALGNIGLDLLGRARALYTWLGSVDGTGRSEDDYAYWRDEREFRHVGLVEQPRGDFADEMIRLLLVSALDVERYAALASTASAAGVGARAGVAGLGGVSAPAGAGALGGIEALGGIDALAGIAGKALNESRYHRDHARLWVVRLGDGTEESHARMTAALERVAPYVDELFTDSVADRAAVDAGIGVLPSSLREPVLAYVGSALAEATLDPLPEPSWHARGGRDGLHSEACGYLLAEMQYLARSHPGATW